MTSQPFAWSIIFKDPLSHTGIDQVHSPYWPVHSWRWLRPPWECYWASRPPPPSYPSQGFPRCHPRPSPGSHSLPHSRPIKPADWLAALSLNCTSTDEESWRELAVENCPVRAALTTRELRGLAWIRWELVRAGRAGTRPVTRCWLYLLALPAVTLPQLNSHVLTKTRQRATLERYTLSTPSISITL